MLIGSAANGAYSEIGVLELDGEDPVVIHAMTLRPRLYRFLEPVSGLRHSDKDIEQAAERFEPLADQLDPASAVVESTGDLRAIARRRRDGPRGRGPATRSRPPSRTRGRSWNQIAVAFGVSRQAARQRIAPQQPA